MDDDHTPATGSATVTFYGVYAHHQPLGGVNPHVVLPPNAVESRLFAAGGLYWSARFLCHRRFYGGAPCVTMSLHLWTPGVKARASWQLTVVDPVRGALLPTTLYTSPPRDYMASDDSRWELDSVYISDRCFWYVDDAGQLVLQITVTVVDDGGDDPDPETSSSTMTAGKKVIEVPPSDMMDQLGEVFQTREGADVTFSVAGELVAAHKIVLAMRSRVFRAMVYGEMKESGAQAQPIEIGDMAADTFGALLRYIYTDDSSPAINEEEADGGQKDNNDKQVWELLKAADRFSVERLKLICERVLCQRLDVDNVADMLGLADRHHCGALKDACIEFMTTSQRMGDVKKTQGFLNLKASQPHLLVEVLEKSSEF